jgi:hypothetical protein
MISILAGLMAGFVHVLAGPDHLAAIAPYSVKSHRKGWRLGFSWGAGHAGGVVLVGLLAVALRGALPLERISGWSERLVGVALVAIGLWGIRSGLRNRVHAHPHVHGQDEHLHVHIHAPGEEHDRPAAHAHTHAAFAVGTLHGLAGSSHVLGVLPALAIPSGPGAVLYLTAFGLGSVAAMSAFSAVVGLLAARCDTTGSRVYQGMMGLCSVGAIVVGCFWLAAT